MSEICIICNDESDDLLKYEHKCGIYYIHSSCLNEWIDINKTSCVVCRENIISSDEEEEPPSPSGLRIIDDLANFDMDGTALQILQQAVQQVVQQAQINIPVAPPPQENTGAVRQAQINIPVAPPPQENIHRRQRNHRLCVIIISIGVVAAVIVIVAFFLTLKYGFNLF